MLALTLATKPLVPPQPMKGPDKRSRGVSPFFVVLVERLTILRALGALKKGKRFFVLLDLLDGKTKGNVEGCQRVWRAWDDVIVLG